MDSVLYQYRWIVKVYNDDTEVLIKELFLDSSARAYSHAFGSSDLQEGERYRAEIYLVYNRQIISEAVPLYYDETGQLFDGPLGALDAQEQGEDLCSITIFETTWPHGPMVVQEQGQDVATGAGTVTPPVFDFELFAGADDPEVDTPLQSIQDISAQSYPIEGLAPTTTYKWRVRTVLDRAFSRYSDWVLSETFETSASGMAAQETGEDLCVVVITVTVSAVLAAQGELYDTLAAAGAVAVAASLQAQGIGEDTLTGAGEVLEAGVPSNLRATSVTRTTARFEWDEPL